MDWIFLAKICGLAYGLVLLVSLWINVTVHVPTLWNGTDFVNLILIQRTLYLGGRKGGGKTCLMAFIAALLHKMGRVDTIHFNIPSVLSEPVQVPIERAVFGMDEVQRVLKRATAAADAENFLRKFDMWLLMAGVQPPHRLLTSLRAWRVFNAYTIGIPAWIFRWRYTMEGEKPDYGWFWLVKPHLVFNFYDTEMVPPDDGGLFEALEQTTAIKEEEARQRLIASGEIDNHDNSSTEGPSEGDGAGAAGAGEAGGNATEGQEPGSGSPGRTETVTEALYEVAEEFGAAAADFQESSRRIQAASRRNR